jgi:hypothetical protein
MRLTGYKRLHFSDWLITVSCQENCLFRVTAYNSVIDSVIVIDKTYLSEEDAFGAMIEQLKSIMIGTEVGK